MMIIRKDRKRRITIRLGFLWHLIKSLPVDEFDMATEIICNLCHDLDVDWNSIQRASKSFEEVMSHRKDVQENE